MTTNPNLTQTNLTKRTKMSKYTIAPLVEHEFVGVLSRGLIDRLETTYRQQLGQQLQRLPTDVGNLVARFLTTEHKLGNMHTFVDGRMIFGTGPNAKHYNRIMKTKYTQKRVHIRFAPTLRNCLAFEGKLDTLPGPKRVAWVQDTYNFGKRPSSKCRPGNTKTPLYKSIPKNTDLPIEWVFDIPAVFKGIQLY